MGCCMEPQLFLANFLIKQKENQMIILEQHVNKLFTESLQLRPAAFSSVENVFGKTREKKTEKCENEVIFGVFTIKIKIFII